MTEQETMAKGLAERALKAYHQDQAEAEAARRRELVEIERKVRYNMLETFGETPKVTMISLREGWATFRDGTKLAICHQYGKEWRLAGCCQECDAVVPAQVANNIYELGHALAEGPASHFGDGRVLCRECRQAENRAKENDGWLGLAEPELQIAAKLYRVVQEMIRREAE